MRARSPESNAENSSRVRRSGHTPATRGVHHPTLSSIRRYGGDGGSHNVSAPEAFYTGSSGIYMPSPMAFYEFRESPNMPQSTPVQTFNVPNQRELFDAQFDYNFSRIARDDPARVMMTHSQRKQQPSRYFSQELPQSSSACGRDKCGDSQYLLKQSYLRDAEQEAAMSSSKPSPKRESLMEWFDRTVESELRKRREASLNVGENVINLDSPSFNPLHKGYKSKFSSNPLLTHASTSGIEVQAALRGETNTDLLDAVDKLAKAQAVCAFEGAVRAAEEAAASVPPEFAEEAAAAGAQGFEAKLTNVVRQEFDGVKPIEVVGYVGITRPNKPKKSK
ncbi:hypothetical protein RI129_006996 [Pyrocoelia pectoralis]|uniref:Uncharacterized protein n=1 Tax=Pyrocoelia pectoralis TaxID=417401 RepID=A0AAN7VCS3_9COLE